MYLKALDIQGFKSFPDKTHLSFTADITAIVGPNGSGKSNISDAIRWVLGEQSAKSLRGAKMEDVIFGGTQKRAPLGFAEVSLTIDNTDGRLASDFSEVTVTRRYYRSGEGEFYINRRAARLKDIHELFMDTGLGRDGYSSIGQGRIDEILALKSDDRRDFFEEAAGISKFRYRKEETERKLDSAEQNLVRIRDILSELTAQVEPLREQAEKAKKYLLLRDRLKSLEICCWLNSLEKLGTELQKVGDDLKNAELQLDGEKAELDNLYKQSGKISEDMRDKDILLESLRAELSDTERMLSENSGSISALKAKSASNMENIERIEQEIAGNSGRQSKLAAQIEEKRDKISELEHMSQELSEQISQLLLISDKNAELTAALSSDERNALSLRDRLYAELAEIKERSSALTSAREQISRGLSQMSEQTDEQQSRLDSEKSRASELELELCRCRQHYDEISNIKAGAVLKAQAKRQKADALAAESSALQNECAALSDRVSLLSEMQKDYEGFSFAVKRVMRESERGFLKNIHGTVSQVITVRREYALAAETALGAALSNIITQSENDAKAAIAFLKSAECGRATFLPIDTIKGSLLKESGLASEHGFIGLAADLCEYPDKYSQIIANLTGRTAVADNIDSAVKIARRYGYKFKIVTLDGQVVNAGGSMTGGSAGKNSGILSRAAELSAKQSELTEKQARAKELYAAAEQAKQAAAAASDDAEVINSELREAESLIVKLSAEQSQHKLLVDSLSENFEQSAERRGKSQAELEKTDAEQRSLSLALSQKQRELNDADNKISEILQNKQDLLSKESQLSRQISEQRALAAQYDINRQALTDTLCELTSLCSQITGDERHKHELIAQYRLSCEDAAAQIKFIGCRSDELSLKAEDIRLQIRRQNECKTELEGLRVKADACCRSKNDDILNLERECSRLNAKIEQLSSETQQIRDKMWESYELTEIGARDMKIEIEDFAAAGRQISQIRTEIRALGAVNVGAIEEYGNVSERYEFMKAQCDDLEKSKSELMQLISELSKNMEQIFTEQFEIINANFNSTFSEIFGGGSAELVLTDPGSVLTCGIEIRARLPGKSVKTISLLSGGEKAFVAIALYFAVLKVRPSPFCILDEIEAALDDMNVDRFAKYMRKLCSSTQFIVITHRRGTMEQSDILYGVTMQEHGISKLLALNIGDVEKQLKFTPD